MSIFLQTEENIAPPEVVNATDKDELPCASQKEPWLCCKQCRYILTHPDYATAPEGYHEHLQCNPAGITFIFSCFEQARGCFVSGSPSSEFSWFKGFDWQFALCQGCGEHLGWYFSRPSGEIFFALINTKIRLQESF